MSPLIDMVKRALVADNDIFFTRLVADYLMSKGISVVIAHDGKEAIEKLQKGPLDFVIVDLIMPKINGQEVIRLTKKKYSRIVNHKGKEVMLPFIVLVTSSLLEQFDKVIDTGADFYLPKGRADVLLEAIENILNFGGEIFGTHRREMIDEFSIFPREATTDLLNEIEFLHAVIESLPFGVITVDKDTKILRVNNRASEYVNMSNEDLIGKSIFSIFPAPYRDLLRKGLLKTLEDGNTNLAVLEGDTNAFFSKMWFSLFLLEGIPSGWLVAFYKE